MRKQCKCGHVNIKKIGNHLFDSRDSVKRLCHPEELSFTRLWRGILFARIAYALNQTRFLDWARNDSTAMHFCTSQASERDSEYLIHRSKNSELASSISEYGLRFAKLLKFGKPHSSFQSSKFASSISEYGLLIRSCSGKIFTFIFILCSTNYVFLNY